ncbi:hypothetical protein [Chromatium okenii]|nr:hypothetical protein [Chromatium okenii]
MVIEPAPVVELKPLPPVIEPEPAVEIVPEPIVELVIEARARTNS